MPSRVVKSVCPKDCPDVCGMLTHVEDGRVVRVVGDPDHPITRGFLCGRFQHYEEFVHHPDRLLHPLGRTRKTASFERMSWDAALDTIAERFSEIVERRGGAAILPYHYLGHMGLVANRYADRLWNKLNASRVGGEICATAGVEATLRIFGRIRGTEPQHLAKTRCYIAWGKNPKDTNVHGYVLTKDIHPFVVVDPFRSETAMGADIHVQPRPGTDSLLAIGMMRVLIEHDWIDHDFLRERTTGFPALREKVLGVSLDEVERVTNVPASLVREVARLYAERRPSLIHVGVGILRNRNGGEMCVNALMLGALTGQVGMPGGGAFLANYEWAYDDISYPELRTETPRFYNMVKLGRFLTESDEVKALYVYNQNPAATCPNQNLVRAGLSREDLFVVVHDMFMTDTAQLADIVLPCCSYAEQVDLHRSYWHDYVQLNNQAIEPLGESRSNYWVFREIARRMGFTERCFSQSEEEVIREALQGTGLDLEELGKGPVLAGDPARTSFDDGRFPTPSGKLELGVPTHTPYDEPGYRYRFLTPKTRHLQGSQVFNLPRKWPALRVPWVLIHPADAAAEGIRDRDRVRVWNERGEVELVARVSDRVQPGVIASFMVRWGPNANATTPDAAADLGGNSTFHSNYVSLEAVSSASEAPGPAASVWAPASGTPESATPLSGPR